MKFLFFSFERESLYLTKDKITKMEHNKNQLENNIDRAQDQQNM